MQQLVRCEEDAVELVLRHHQYLLVGETELALPFHGRRVHSPAFAVVYTENQSAERTLGSGGARKRVLQELKLIY